MQISFFVGPVASIKGERYTRFKPAKTIFVYSAKIKRSREVRRQLSSYTTKEAFCYGLDRRRGVKMKFAIRFSDGFCAWVSADEIPDFI